jgi:hypothetical protein
METMTAPTSEKRLDDLREETHRGFDDLRKEMHRGFDRVETDTREIRSEMKAGFDSAQNQFESLQRQLESLQRLMIRFFAGTLASVVVAIIASHF